MLHKLHAIRGNRELLSNIYDKGVSIMAGPFLLNSQ